MNPWDESLRTQRMRNGLALFNAEDKFHSVKPERNSPRFSLNPFKLTAKPNDEDASDLDDPWFDEEEEEEYSEA